MKLSLRWKVFGSALLLVGGSIAALMFAPVIYEFPSCEPGSKVINVMRVPYGYQSFPANKLIRDDQPIGWLETDPKGSGSIFYRNGGLSSSYLYSTYPDYEPLGWKTWKDYSELERESRDPKNLLFATVEFSRSVVMHPSNDSYIHDLNGKRTKTFQRIREDSIDGNYWVYPEPEQRAKFPYGRVPYKPNYFAEFVPKDMVFHVRIACTDTGVNTFPDQGHCFIHSDWSTDPSLSCMSVEYRIAAKDMPHWREFDKRVKQKIESLISQRKHGYSASLTQKEN